MHKFLVCPDVFKIEIIDRDLKLSLINKQYNENPVHACVIALESDC